MNHEFRSQEDFIRQYVTGQNLLKGDNPEAFQEFLKGNKPEVGNPVPFSTGLFNARRQAYSKNPIVPNMADYVNWFYYDRIVYAAGATIPTQFQLFVIPYNTGGKTKADTNLQLISQLPQPFWMNATSFAISWNPDAALTDIQAFCNQSWFEWVINDKIYAEGKLEMYPSGGGVNGTASGIPGMSFSNGSPNGPGMQFDLRLPAGLNLGTQTDPATGAQTPVVTDGLTGITILQSQIFKVNFYLANTITLATSGANHGMGFNPTVYIGGILSRSVA
jgi:hypothetical protein